MQFTIDTDREEVSSAEYQESVHALTLLTRCLLRESIRETARAYELDSEWHLTQEHRDYQQLVSDLCSTLKSLSRIESIWR